MQRGNTRMVANLFVSALSVSGAICLILEMYTPYASVMQSPAPRCALLLRIWANSLRTERAFNLSRLVFEDPRHASFEVIEIVAVEDPPPGIVGTEFDAHSLARRNVHGVLEWRAFPRTLQDAEKVTVEVHRMPHQSFVAQFDLDVIALTDQERIALRINLAVNHPLVFGHVALQRECERTCRTWRKRRRRHGAQVAVRKRAALERRHREICLRCGVGRVQYTDRLSGTVDGGSMQRIATRAGEGNDRVVDLRHPHLQVVDGDRFHRETVRVRDRERMPVETQSEVR